MQEYETPEKNYDLERLVFFSDGVFAIAITLLVIELHAPEDWDHGLISLLNALGAKVLFYVVSFSAIGGFWMSHRLIFRHVQRFSEATAWFNLLFLMCIGLVPLANSLLLEGRMSLAAIEVYLGLIVLICLTLGLLWVHLSLVSRLLDTRVSESFRWMTLVRLAVIPPAICSTSLWVGMGFGLWPAVVLLVLATFLSGRLQPNPYTSAKAKAAGDAPTA